MQKRRVVDIYEEYKIMPGLQEHQLRVAAVGKLITDNFDIELDKNAVVLACLFHDMGNILKSDLTLLPELLGEHDLEYWQEVKDGFAMEYGPNEHDAALMIGAKIGLSDTVMSLVSGVGFTNLEAIRDHDRYEMKIVEYADLRVAPHGIRPMHERVDEAGKRYIGRHPDMPTDESELHRLIAAADDIERQLFSHCSLVPEDITDERAARVVDELRTYEIA